MPSRSPLRLLAALLLALCAQTASANPVPPDPEPVVVLIVQMGHGKTCLVFFGITDPQYQHERSKSAIGNRLGFQGRANFGELGLQYFRNRFYSPDTGRFISSDPLGMVDGPNTYGFCGGDPVNRSDPMGTDWAIIANDRIQEDTIQEETEFTFDETARIRHRLQQILPQYPGGKIVRISKPERRVNEASGLEENYYRPLSEIAFLTSGTALPREQRKAQLEENARIAEAIRQVSAAQNTKDAIAQADMIDLGDGVQMLNPFSARGKQRLSDVAPEAFEMVGGINWREASAGEWALWAITLPAGGKGAQLARGGKKVYVALRKGQALRKTANGALEVVDVLQSVGKRRYCPTKEVADRVMKKISDVQQELKGKVKIKYNLDIPHRRVKTPDGRIGERYGEYDPVKKEITIYSEGDDITLLEELLHAKHYKGGNMLGAYGGEIDVKQMIYDLGVRL